MSGLKRAAIVRYALTQSGRQGGPLLPSLKLVVIQRCCSHLNQEEPPLLLCISHTDPVPPSLHIHVVPHHPPPPAPLSCT